MTTLDLVRNIVILQNGKEIFRISGKNLFRFTRNELRKEWLGFEDFEKIREIQSFKNKTKYDFANDEFADFEPLGNGMTQRQGIRDFVGSWK